ncbi:DUF2076 family protein [Mesorhizobium sp.]|uniref:DUF2076 family protein n=1 Tax=Mesorhizobium sp. TaxID=1871066 RepID=UPI000FE75D7C|nr:DUF2076 family protein [Mesorhizobium sp.]RWN54059.1 MAG: DUF2076 family protein [Mesorhizobium sp.]
MDRNDQQAIGTLFEKLANVERQTPPRAAEAERFINDQIAVQPGAPYYMAPGRGRRHGNRGKARADTGLSLSGCIGRSWLVGVRASMVAIRLRSSRRSKPL